MAGVGDRRVHVLVTGEVQGVGYRWFTREQAQSRRVRGWVRNRADGSVELVAGGAANDVQAFLDAIERGPARSRVRELHVRDETPDEELPFPFEIRR